MIESTEALGEKVGVAQACRVVGVPRRSVYRARKPKAEPAPRPTPARALSAEEKAEIRGVLNSERFCDSAPREVYATLLDEEGVYYCHWRTMYRILEEHDEVCERRKQRRHPKRAKPELRATGPKQIWSWDVTQLKGPGRFYYLYTIIDVFSRYVVGWMIANQESGELARQLIADTCAKQGIERDRLILHTDRGSVMRAKTVRELLA
jgi:putative transposase